MRTRTPVTVKPVTVKIVRQLALELPGVEEGPCYGTIGFRVRGRFLARLWEDGETLVVKCGDEERDRRLEKEPQTYFVTDHYRGYPSVLVRLTAVRREDLRDLLERAWRRSAPQKLVAEYDRRQPATPRRRMARHERHPEPNDFAGRFFNYPTLRSRIG